MSLDLPLFALCLEPGADSVQMLSKLLLLAVAPSQEFDVLNAHVQVSAEAEAPFAGVAGPTGLNSSYISASAEGRHIAEASAAPEVGQI